MSNLKNSDFAPHEILTLNNYGYIKVKLDEALKSRGVSRNKLKNLVGSSYNVIARYCRANDTPMRSVDLDLLARICCVLKCQLDDLPEYIPNE